MVGDATRLNVDHFLHCCLCGVYAQWNFPSCSGLCICSETHQCQYVSGSWIACCVTHTLLLSLLYIYITDYCSFHWSGEWKSMMIDVYHSRLCVSERVTSSGLHQQLVAFLPTYKLRLLLLLQLGSFPCMFV